MVLKAKCENSKDKDNRNQSTVLIAGLVGVGETESTVGTLLHKRYGRCKHNTFFFLLFGVHDYVGHSFAILFI
jgi:hypothetical protein